MPEPSGKFTSNNKISGSKTGINNFASTKLVTDWNSQIPS